MIITKADRKTIYENLFKEGVLVAKKDLYVAISFVEGRGQHQGGGHATEGMIRLDGAGFSRRIGS